MTTTEKRPRPQPRIRNESGEGFAHTVVEAPFAHDDGWHEVTVGWSEDDDAWIARCLAQSGCLGISESSQLHAMADLVRSLAGLCAMFMEREAELHRAIHNSPDALAKELREAEKDLHSVQAYITTKVEPEAEGGWNEGLQPLWRAERALEAFAARIANAKGAA